ncbi:class I SAM-dependent methyltransferase [Nocardia sp. NPDC058480]|uniref:class I SAM-dependent methyltransferase n=1 Tax=Nocardia sp. NPDC058480 TaxID=3346522 RepID=UPI00365AF7A7
MSATDAVTFWNGVYATRSPATDPQPNDLLTEVVSDLSPADALDLGCGDGGDTLWLADRGWHVTAVDISAVALARLTDLTSSHGLGSRVTTEPHDLRKSFPQGRFDLISAHYLHTPFGLDRAPSCARPRTRCARAGDCWSSTTARLRHGRGIRTPTSATRARGKSRRVSI